ncbi:MAG TPA: 50S ribosomal protein L29 [Phycisphaerales bacterium]|nr:50S ribosomal protein L29 [Phycisphaerales bacterium]
MKGVEVHKLTGEEIDTELVRLSRRLYDLRCQTVTEKIEDPSQFKKVRRDVARLKTEQRARVLRQTKASGAKA